MDTWLNIMRGVKFGLWGSYMIGWDKFIGSSKK